MDDRLPSISAVGPEIAGAISQNEVLGGDGEGALFESGWWSVFERLSVPVLVYHLDESGRPLPFTRANDAALNLYGYRLEELLRMSSLDLVDPSVLDVPKAIDSLRQSSFAIVASQHIARDGRRIPIEVHAHYFEMGGCPTIVSVCLDVSKRQRAEDAVRARERQLGEILESVHDSFVALDRDWRITYVNRRAASSVGAEPDSFIGRHLFEQFPGYIGTPIETAARRAMESGQPVGEEVFSPVTNRWLEVNFNPTSEGLSIFARDVSERKRAALAIARQSEQARAMAAAFTQIASERRLDDKLRLIVDNVREVVSTNRAVITLREDGNSLDTTEMASQAVGYEPPSSAQLTRENEQLEKVLREDRILNVTKHDPAASDAEGTGGGFLGAPLRGRDGAIYGVIHLSDKVEGDFSEDDTAILTQFAQFASNAIEAVRAERARLEEAEKFRILAEAMPQKVFLQKPDGTGEYLNSQWTHFTGLSRKELQDVHWISHIHPDDRDAIGRAWTQAVASRTPFQFEHRFKRSDGEYRWHITRALPMRDEAGEVTMWVGSSTDIHERVEAQDQLEELNASLEARVAERAGVAEQQALQLRHLAGQLTRAEQKERRRLANMLHDHLQQLLVAAKFGLSIASQHLPAEEYPALQQSDELIGEAIELSRTLTAELSPPVLHAAGLRAAIEWLIRWMSEKHGISVVTDMSEGAEPSDEHVRVILFEAARELLFNVVKHAKVKSASLRLSTVDDNCIEMTIHDNGVGFDPQRVAENNLLVGGLGLRSIKERVGYFGGQMAVDSAPGKGTTITLTAPADVPLTASGMFTSGTVLGDARERSQADKGRASTPQTGTNSVRVLVADDHRILREGLTSLLGDHNGIEVVGQAGDGQMAVDMARTLRPDVIIMDITMPNLNGIEATRRIKAELPDTRIVGLSMHTEADMAAALQEAGASVYLTKGGPVKHLIDAILDK